MFVLSCSLFVEVRETDYASINERALGLDHRRINGSRLPAM
jgi:hypothetical protein